MTGIKDTDGADQAEFNEGVWKASQGWPVLVQAATKLIPEHPDDLSKIRVAQSADNVFERQAKEWAQASYHQTDSEILLNLLRTLAIFEPVAPFDLESIQAFFAYQQVDLSLADLRQLLQPVSTQLEGLSTGQVKLSLKAFAEYVRDRYCSRKDLERAIKTVVAWLSEDQDVSAKMLTAFLQYWTNPTYVREDRFRITASHLVDVLIVRGDEALLYDIFKSSSFFRLRRKKKSPEESFPRFAEQCLSAAAELGHIAAMRNFGNLLIDGTGLTQDQAKGQEWLYKGYTIENNFRATFT